MDNKSSIIKKPGTGAGLTFVNLKGKVQVANKGDENEYIGAMVLSGTKEVLPSGTEIAGYIKSVEVKKSEYQGNPIYSLNIRMSDQDGQAPDAVLSVTLGSYFAAKVVGGLHAANLAEPVTISAYAALQGEMIGDTALSQDMVFPTTSQNGERVKPTWSGCTELPDAKEVMVSGKKYKDMDPVNAVVEHTIIAINKNLAQLSQRDAQRIAQALHDGPMDDHGISAEDLNAALHHEGASALSPRARY